MTRKDKLLREKSHQKRQTSKKKSHKLVTKSVKKLQISEIKTKNVNLSDIMSQHNVKKTKRWKLSEKKSQHSVKKT